MVYVHCAWTRPVSADEEDGGASVRDVEAGEGLVPPVPARTQAMAAKHPVPTGMAGYVSKFKQAEWIAKVTRPALSLELSAADTHGQPGLLRGKLERAGSGPGSECVRAPRQSTNTLAVCIKHRIWLVPFEVLAVPLRDVHLCCPDTLPVDSVSTPRRAAACLRAFMVVFYREGWMLVRLDAP